MAAHAPIWTPGTERIARAHFTRFSAWLAQHRGLRFDDYESMWRWSVGDLEGFWTAAWQYFDIPVRQPFTRALADDRMPGAKWFEGAQLNFVDQVFRHAGLGSPAIVYESEAGGSGELSWAQLQRQVAAVADTLREMGVQPGDRVVGWMPNIPQTVVAFLACASLGAVWSVCAPDMGPVSVGDRFRQIEPKVILAVDGYRFGGKPFDRRAVFDEILAQLPSVTGVLWVPHLDPAAPGPTGRAGLRVVPWQDASTRAAAWNPTALPADHPLWILYSSGTTGLPKAIVHGHGGIVANGLVNMVLHGELHPGDRILWAVNTSWMVWNAHVLGLLGGASIVLYDGAVTGAGAEPDWSHLWRLAGRLGVHVFGVGAAIHHACMKAGVVPREVAELSALHTVCSTGSPLSPEAYDWLYQRVKADLWLNCVAGGTDIAGGFLVGLPTLPVRVGQMQCRTLGASVHAFDETGQPVIGQVGELVCTRPLPSMPLRFWGDEGNARLLDSYFDTFRTPDGGGIWRHGDWLELVPNPEAVGGIIYGRSDATINRQGVRMGTAEFYRVVEGVDEVLDSLVVDLEYLGRESYMVLFVQLRPGIGLDEPLRKRLVQALRTGLSARHVPNDIIAVARIPKTITGKKMELPIKKLMLGHPLEKVINRDAVADPAAIDWYVDFARAHLARAAADVGPA
ncbi:acetoacetate--CoA ligase [Ramlibacter sp. AW1]|uniref:Acetoacetate--CoA ligase n=1 Tax=Ramlibacter aurantiacus TaxID=2801330 RepID=A0A937D7A2_9BURK|nr:acetoacetate--CoA ligase [Ramlibacter aurantiacus]MBL0420726.1 acetoacetate--CoA ligase [Ramlibacter aurantiacus]